MIDKVDERFLKAVYSMVSSYQSDEDEVIGYRIGSGQPVYRSALAGELDQAVEKVKQGEYLTLEELEIDSESW